MTKMPTEDQVVDMLREIVDPHTGLNIYDMGLISDISVSVDHISLTFRPTSSFCPLGIHLALNIKRRLTAIEGVESADVTVVGHIHEVAINRKVSEA
ncbi:MAG: iron-sulfur cluster assembly protein [Thermoplasmata archaeon]|nr:iron-sulfur cluster assembly protein [Thermoplasmata archaeon]